MKENSERQFLLIPPLMGKILDELVVSYADAVNETPDEVRRLVEIAVLTRGVRMMREQVEVERKFSERMGWT